MIEQAAEVVGVRVNGLHACAEFAEPVAALVEHHEAVLRAKPVPDLPPDSQVGAERVHESNGRSSLCWPILVVEAYPTDLNEPHAEATLGIPAGRIIRF